MTEPLRSKRRRNAFLKNLEAFRRLSDAVALPEMLCLLYVAENEGVSLKELAFIARLTESTASRTVRSLIAANAPRSLPPSLGLLELRRSPHDLRICVIVLSDRGRELCARLDETIRIGDTIRPRPEVEAA